MSDQTLAELSWSLPHGGAHGVAVWDDFRTVRVPTANILPLSVASVGGFCQNPIPPLGGEEASAAGAGGLAAAGAGSGAGCGARGAAVPAAAAGAPALGSVLPGNVGCATWFSRVTFSSVFRRDCSPAVVVALICWAGSDPARTGVGCVLVALNGFESSGEVWVVVGF